MTGARNLGVVCAPTCAFTHQTQRLKKKKEDPHIDNTGLTQFACFHLWRSRLREKSDACVCPAGEACALLLRLHGKSPNQRENKTKHDRPRLIGWHGSHSVFLLNWGVIGSSGRRCGCALFFFFILRHSIKQHQISVNVYEDINFSAH